MGAVSQVVQGAWTAAVGTSDLNSLANGSQFTSTLTAPQIDNSAGAWLYAEFEVSLAALSPTNGANIIVFLIPETSTAGTYATGDDGATAGNQARWQNGPYAAIALNTKASNAQTQLSSLVPIQARKYKLAVINRSGVALAASGNLVKYRLSTESIAG
jgi:hypothetical protein